MWAEAHWLRSQSMCVHEFFERQAAATPDAVALVFEGAEMTYGDLSVHSTALMRAAAGGGCGADMLVGLMLPRCFDLVVGDPWHHEGGWCVRADRS